MPTTGNCKDATRTKLKVYGMRSALLGEEIRNALGELDGVQEVRFEISTRRVDVVHEPLPGIVNRLCEALESLGFHVTPKA
ncbi:MAG: heavy-metal-associated domain-containing protein [Mycobacterium leprae]